MGRITKAITFWIIRALCVVGLWYAARLLGYSTSLWEFVVGATVVLLGDWLGSRFPALRTRPGKTMVSCALGAIIAGTVADRKFQLVANGYETRKSLVAAVVAVVVLAACGLISVWSYLHLRRSAATN